MRYVEVTPEEIRPPNPSNCYLSNCYAMFPWLAELHEPSAADCRVVLGAIAQQSKAIALDRIAQITGLDCEVVMAVACRSQVRGIIQIEEIRTQRLDYESRVSGRSI